MVIGSGVYRIGSSVEFDWCAVRSIQVDIETSFYSVLHVSPAKILKSIRESRQNRFQRAM
jgi:hypothetical protein